MNFCYKSVLNYYIIFWKMSHPKPVVVVVVGATVVVVVVVGATVVVVVVVVVVISRQLANEPVAGSPSKPTGQEQFQLPGILVQT